MTNTNNERPVSDLVKEKIAKATGETVAPAPTVPKTDEKKDAADTAAISIKSPAQFCPVDQVAYPVSKELEQLIAEVMKSSFKDFVGTKIVYNPAPNPNEKSMIWVVIRFRLLSEDEKKKFDVDDERVVAAVAPVSTVNESGNRAIDTIKRMMVSQRHSTEYAILSKDAEDMLAPFGPKDRNGKRTLKNNGTVFNFMEPVDFTNGSHGKSIFLEVRVPITEILTAIYNGTEGDVYERNKRFYYEATFLRVCPDGQNFQLCVYKRDKRAHADAERKGGTIGFNVGGANNINLANMTY